MFQRSMLPPSWTSKILSYHNTTWHHNPKYHDLRLHRILPWLSYVNNQEYKIDRSWKISVSIQRMFFDMSNISFSGGLYDLLIIHYLTTAFLLQTLYRVEGCFKLRMLDFLIPLWGCITWMDRCSWLGHVFIFCIWVASTGSALRFACRVSF
jgi:hypothetical protein